MDILTGLVLGWFALGQLNPPAPRPPEPRQDEQKLSANKNGDAASNNAPAQTNPTSFDQDNSKPSQGPHGDKGQPNEENPSSDWFDDFVGWRFWSPLNASLLTLFNGILACVAMVQWRFMREQSRLMRDSLTETRRTVDAANESARAAAISATAAVDQVAQMKNDQRARISVFGTRLEKAITAGEWLVLNTKVRNTGRTQAVIEKQASYCFSIYPEFDIGPQVDRLERELDEQPAKSFVLAPDGTHVVHGRHDAIRLADELTLNGILNGGMELILVVGVRYRDIFGVGHSVRTCFVYKAEAKEFWGYPHYNQMD